MIYAHMRTDGSVKNVYAVNSFEKGKVIDYGSYDSVKMLNTEDPIRYKGNRITFSTDAEKAYYQGEFSDAEIPWDISLRYYLNGEEYPAHDIAGRDGRLEIRFKINENVDCKGGFYDEYGLQASFMLDTERCSDITAPDATVANVGSTKQLTYTILPGDGIDTIISADVSDFEMEPVAINGIRLNLGIETDDAVLKEKINDMIAASVELNKGAGELHNGSMRLGRASFELQKGAARVNNGMYEFDRGIGTLLEGMDAIYGGLNGLDAQSADLVKGSGEFKKALMSLQAEMDHVFMDVQATARIEDGMSRAGSELSEQRKELKRISADLAKPGCQRRRRSWMNFRRKWEIPGRP